MGVCLYYYTEKQVDPGVRAAVRGEALYVGDGRPWLYCEPVCLLDMEGYEGRLSGRSKLNPFPHPSDRRSAEIEGGDPLDIRAVIDALCKWSRTYGIDWVISLEGETGRIVAGECDPNAQALVDGLGCLADLDVDGLLNDLDGLDLGEGPT
jgi:hypothetical protein